MNLRAKIINLEAQFPDKYSVTQRFAFLLGHKQARHAAAELANEADAVRDELLGALQKMVHFFGHPKREEWASDESHRGALAIEAQAVAAIAKAAATNTEGRN